MGKAALVGVLAGFVIVFFGLAVGGTQPMPALNESPNLMPGSTTYRVYWCDYQHTKLTALYCEAFYNAQVVGVILHGNRITQSTWPVQDMVVADFIVLWRAPSGIYYSQEMQVVRIYWGSTSIWLRPERFSPDSRVYYVSYGATPEAAVQPWRGFILPKSADVTR